MTDVYIHHVKNMLISHEDFSENEEFDFRVITINIVDESGNKSDIKIFSHKKLKV